MQVKIYLFRFKSDYGSWEEIVVSDRKITADDAQQIVASMCPPEAQAGENVEVFELEARVVSDEQARERMASAGCMGMYLTDAGDLVAKFRPSNSCDFKA